LAELGSPQAYPGPTRASPDARGIHYRPHQFQGTRLGRLARSLAVTHRERLHPVLPAVRARSDDDK